MGRNCSLLAVMLLWLSQCKLYLRGLQFPPQMAHPVSSVRRKQFRMQGFMNWLKPDMNVPLLSLRDCEITLQKKWSSPLGMGAGLLLAPSTALLCRV